jgi:hypothetical protein
MKQPTKQLLDDLLEDVASREFRASVLDQTLRAARQRKRVRQQNIALIAAACVAIFAFILWKAREPLIVLNPAQRPVSTIVRSKTLNPPQVVRAKLGGVEMVSSSASTFTPVETRASEPFYTEIDDAQLFALLVGKPVALVHRGPNQGQLIFLNPEVEKGFPIQ